jgi:UDP-N-acetylmuramate dehydrogenase
MKIEKNKNLLDLNTFMVPSVTKEYVKITSIEEIKELINTGKFKTPFYILGGGSNTLFTDFYDGLVVNIDLQDKKIIEELMNT